MSATATGTPPVPIGSRLDALVIGAGFGGMYAVHRLRAMGLSVQGLEAGNDVGGTWYWNRYPGARCDVMSIDYSYSFSDEIMQEWTWSEQFAAQPEILAYANWVADKLDLRRNISFGVRATRIEFDNERELWSVETDAGTIYEVTYLVMATGPLSVPKWLDIPGIEAFRGEIYQAQRWPHVPVDLAGKRIGVIGVGSTGIQIVPAIAEQAAALTVFQRTPSFTLPMRNRRLEPDYVSQIKAHYPYLRAQARNTAIGGVRPITSRPLFSVPAADRQKLMEDAWKEGALAFLSLFSDLLLNQDANNIVAEFVRGKIDEVVRDGETAEKLKPRGYPIFARRPCLDTNYYETFNRPNVSLVDCLADPIQEVVPDGIRTVERKIELDVIIAATGYDALTGAMLAIDITGRDGASLHQKWAAGARSYLALMMAGFPNMFIVAGANGPSALANFILLDEQNVDWICECIGHMRANGLTAMEPTQEAEDAWMDHVHALARESLMPRANTWYTGANIAGKPRDFPMYIGGLNRYRERCDAAIAADFPDFHFARREAQELVKIAG